MTKPGGMLSHLRTNRYDLIVTVTTSAIGLSIALFISFLLKERSDRGTYEMMLNAIVEETEDNRHVYTFSFSQHAEAGLVVREFNLATVQASLSNPMFVRHVDRGTLHVLTNYLRNFALSNGFAETTRTIRIGGSQVSKELLKAWKGNLGASRASIDRVTEFTKG